MKRKGGQANLTLQTLIIAFLFIGSIKINHLRATTPVLDRIQEFGTRVITLHAGGC